MYDPADLWDLGKMRELFLAAEARADAAEFRYKQCCERAEYTERQLNALVEAQNKPTVSIKLVDAAP